VRDGRNLFGGHFHDKAARFAIANLTMEHVGMLVIDFNTLADTYNSLFKFASELVAIGFTAHRGDAEIRSYVRELMKTIGEALECVGITVHVLDEVFVQRRFGV
jgi:hypothetical protein